MPFGLFGKKKSSSQTPVLPIVAKMTNAELVDFLTKSIAELTEPRMQSCTLIGYDHMRTLGPVLAREIPHSPDNADKWDQIADHIFALLRKVYTEPNSSNSEAHKRRLGYFLRGTCLRALETRSIRDPALLNDLAAIWIGLVPGGRALRSAGSATLAYDPAGRLYQTTGSSTTRYLYDGVDVIAEYNTSGTMLRRYVHGPSIDEPVVWYEGAGTSDRRWYVQDQLGSVIGTTNASGASLSINTYDEYGQPGSSNTGRFQYTGQAWLSDASLYHYKARAYAPGLGRFMQSDPILYAGGMNLYRCVSNDPINRVDPLGTDDEPPIVVVGPPRHDTEQETVWNIWKAGAYASPNQGLQSGAAEPRERFTSQKQRSNRNACPEVPAEVLEYLSTAATNAASFLNAQSLGIGRIWEGGGAIGSAGGGYVFTATRYNNGRNMNLPGIRGALARSGVTVLFDWHTHVDEGVFGAYYGFSSRDVYTTANVIDPNFIGSFVVMRDQILFLPRSMAYDRVMSGSNTGSFGGIRCQ